MIDNGDEDTASLFAPEDLPPIPYAAAMVEFLDRETGKVRRAMCYPITRVYLLPLGTARPSFAFTAIPGGHWLESGETELPGPIPPGQEIPDPEGVKRD